MPWHADTATPAYTPLEKLSVLVLPDGTGVHDSRDIREWLEAKHPAPRLLPEAAEGVLAARQVEVIADGVCDAVVLLFFERRREAPSAPWMQRQRRKVEGGVRALATLAEKAGEGVLLGDRFGLSDIAAGTVLRDLAVRCPECDWPGQYPALAAMSARLEARPSFQATTPVPQTITEAVM